MRKERVSWSSRSGPLPHPRTHPLVSLGFTFSPQRSEAGSGSREGRPSGKPVLELVAVITRSQSWWASANVPGPEHVPVWGHSECRRTLALGEKLHVRDKEILYSEQVAGIPPRYVPEQFL